MRIRRNKMAWVEAILLGILQGLTEFLPVSSSGHLVLARSLMPDLETPGILFEVLLHLGTLGSVLYFFRREVKEMLLSCLPGGETASRRLVLYIVAASIPTAFAGFLLRKQIHLLFKSVQTTALMLLVTGVLLILSDLLSKPRVGIYRMGYLRAFGVGLWQSAALMPGLSRSGSTISGARLMGIVGEDAAKFSFLISIPAVGGAALLELKDAGPLDAHVLALCLTGALAAFLAGLAALGLLLAVVKKSRLRWFAYYCWAAGLTVLALGLK